MARLINVHTAFNLQREDGTKEHFARGAHTVSDEDAEHWYVKANAEIGPEVTEDEPESDEEDTDGSGDTDEEDQQTWEQALAEAEQEKGGALSKKEKQALRRKLGL